MTTRAIIGIILLVLLAGNYFLLTPALASQEPIEDIDGLATQPDYSEIMIHMINKPAMLQPIHMLSADDLDQDGIVFSDAEWQEDCASILIDPDLGGVVFSQDLDLPGTLAICYGSDCEVFGNVNLGQGLTSLSGVSIVGSLTTAGEIDIADWALFGGDISTPDNLKVDGDLVAYKSVFCNGLDCGDDALIYEDLAVDGWIVCKGDLQVNGDISCGIGDLQVYGNLGCDGDVSSQGFIYAAWGGIYVDGDIKCDGNCVAGCGIQADGTIDAKGMILAAVNPGCNIKKGVIKSSGILNGFVSRWPPIIINPTTPDKVQSGAEFSGYHDVPGDNWSYNALDYLCREGMLKGFPEGFFRSRTYSHDREGDSQAERGNSGNLTKSLSDPARLLTRYELSQAVHRLLLDIENADEPVPEYIIVIAKALEDEYRYELGEIGHCGNEQ